MRWAIALLVGVIACREDAPGPSDAGSCGPAACGRGTDLACPANSACVGDTLVEPYPATCLPRCTTTADCAPGWRCVSPFGVQTDRVCTSESSPTLCPGAAPALPDCPLIDAYCFADGRTLVQPYRQAANHICGYEITPCPGTCAADGGASCR